MRNSLRLATLGAILLILFLTACSTPPPAVTRNQFEQTQQETIEAERAAERTMQERDNLRSELSRKEAELNSLEDYERTLGN